MQIRHRNTQQSDLLHADARLVQRSGSGPTWRVSPGSISVGQLWCSAIKNCGKMRFMQKVERKDWAEEE